ncbi:MAG: rod shape-determining protein MreC [Flavobacteriales bacterium]|nr:rod shape-determining protein MreC [Flavobacteriales bacterium]MBL0129055.1 rod shape-determining protein MreC [Flavobacteriales bacterium]MCC6938997.1 rod shape-determining protein MreC [Flavobacteriales bacterium]
MRDLFRFLHRIRNTLLFLLLLGISMGLLYNGNSHHRARAISSSNELVGTLFTWRKDITDYANLKEVNERLAAENADWRNRHSSSYTPVEELFVRINDSIYRQQYSYLPAKVVNNTWHKPRNFITLDKGAVNGLHDDMGVIGPDGIVGVIRDVEPHFASVISILNPDVKTSVKTKRTGHYGLLYWDTNDPLTSSVIDIPKHARVHVGDTIVTTGGDGVYPEGVPVGRVLAVNDAPGRQDQAIVVQLFEDLTRSGFVYVVNDLQRAERDSVEKAYVVQ